MPNILYIQNALSIQHKILCSVMLLPKFVFVPRIYILPFFSCIQFLNFIDFIAEKCNRNGIWLCTEGAFLLVLSIMICIGFIVEIFLAHELSWTAFCILQSKSVFLRAAKFCSVFSSPNWYFNKWCSVFLLWMVCISAYCTSYWWKQCQCLSFCVVVEVSVFCGYSQYLSITCLFHSPFGGNGRSMSPLAWLIRWLLAYLTED